MAAGTLKTAKETVSGQEAESEKTRAAAAGSVVASSRSSKQVWIKAAAARTVAALL